MTFIILTAATIGFGVLILSLCRAAGESDRARDEGKHAFDGKPMHPCTRCGLGYLHSIHEIAAQQNKEYEDWRGV